MAHRIIISNLAVVVWNILFVAIFSFIAPQTLIWIWRIGIPIIWISVFFITRKAV